jgi:hypothetical protein
MTLAGFTSFVEMVRVGMINGAGGNSSDSSHASSGVRGTIAAIKWACTTNTMASVAKTRMVPTFEAQPGAHAMP